MGILEKSILGKGGCAKALRQKQAGTLREATVENGERIQRENIAAGNELGEGGWGLWAPGGGDRDEAWAEAPSGSDLHSNGLTPWLCGQENQSHIPVSPKENLSLEIFP